MVQVSVPNGENGLRSWEAKLFELGDCFFVDLHGCEIFYYRLVVFVLEAEVVLVLKKQILNPNSAQIVKSVLRFHVLKPREPFYL